MAVFLTDEWFNEVERLGDEAGDLNLPPALANMSMNLNVTDSEGGDVQAYLSEGKLKKGTTTAPTTLNLTKDAIKDLAFDFDMNKAMQAFMSGKIRVDGDMSQLMTLQSAQPSNEQKQLFEKIIAITDKA